MKEIYQVLAGAMATERQLDQIANNLANVNTTGYKQDRAVFTDYLAQELKNQSAGAADGQPPEAANPALPTFPVFSNGYLDTTQGSFELTGQPLDLAIGGDGYFQIQLEGSDETFYTRAGNFAVNATGELVTVSGQRVLDGNGKTIQLNLNGQEPEVMADGSIQIGNTQVAQLGLVRFDQDWRLEKYGQNLLRAPADLKPQAVDNPSLRSGALENSNVNAIVEMTRMIEAQRSYQSQMKAMQSIDELSSSRIEAASQ